MPAPRPPARRWWCRSPTGTGCRRRCPAACPGSGRGSPRTPQQLLVADLRGVVDDQHHLGVPGPAAADLARRSGWRCGRPRSPTAVVYTPGSRQKIRSAPQKQPMPNTATAEPSGHGGTMRRAEHGVRAATAPAGRGPGSAVLGGRQLGPAVNSLVGPGYERRPTGRRHIHGHTCALYRTPDRGLVILDVHEAIRRRRTAHGMRLIMHNEREMRSGDGPLTPTGERPAVDGDDGPLG